MKRITDTKPFPNIKNLRRPDYLPKLVTKDDIYEWQLELTKRRYLLTTDITPPKMKTIYGAYNIAMRGCNKGRIPDNDWEEIVDYCLLQAIYTWDRNRLANTIVYNEMHPDNPLKLPPDKSCPLPNYFWRLLRFTSCSWIRKYHYKLSNFSTDYEGEDEQD